MRVKSHILICLLLLITACSNEDSPDKVAGSKVDVRQAASLVVTNAKIYTMNESHPWAEAMAVDGERIVYVGDAETVGSFVSATTEVLDLGGKMIMPGIIDAHSHPAWGGVKAIFQCNFSFTSTPDEIASTITSCVENQPDAEWIRGGQWTSDFFKNNDIGSPRLWLDKVSGDKAVLLIDDSGHNFWVNSKALELAGITSDSEDPPGGKFEREPGSRQPNGLLVEAFTTMNKAMPEWGEESYYAGAKHAVQSGNAFGLTGFKDASASEPEVAGYFRLDSENRLSMHVATCLYQAKDDNKNVLDLDHFNSLRERYSSKHVLTDFAKIFLDGVPTASRTAAMLAPYVPEHEGDNDNYGALHLEQEQLNQAVTKLDAAGFTVKIHTAGDRAIRTALNAIEAARKENGRSGLQHELAHAEFIDPEDIPRFAELNVAADFSPYIWFRSPIVDSVINAVGERATRSFPARDLLKANAQIIAGSDWPSAVPDINPWTGIEALLTRSDPLHRFDGVLWPEQALKLDEALRIFTIGGARAFRIEDKTGSLEAGKLADFIVLNHNLFEIEASSISDTKVLMTWFEGKLVHKAE